eukprot:scaffold737_cov176-Prasinococcus_capsulatus_cf.AAC.1
MSAAEGGVAHDKDHAAAIGTPAHLVVLGPKLPRIDAAHDFQGRHFEEEPIQCGGLTRPHRHHAEKGWPQNELLVLCQATASPRAPLAPCRSVVVEVSAGGA